jgi:hypothetical protein
VEGKKEVKIDKYYTFTTSIALDTMTFLLDEKLQREVRAQVDRMENLH